MEWLAILAAIVVFVGTVAVFVEECVVGRVSDVGCVVLDVDVRKK